MVVFSKLYENCQENMHESHQTQSYLTQGYQLQFYWRPFHTIDLTGVTLRRTAKPES